MNKEENMESWKAKIHKNNHKAYGRSKGNVPCRKHPKHIQSPGVCSLCLNQKLSKLTNTCASSRMKRPPNSFSSSSSSSSLSSSDISSYSSPMVSYMDPTGRKATRLSQETLKKSRSMAFFLQRRKGEDGKNFNEIKRGFWSRLLPTKSKTLIHSRTTRERVITAVQ